MRGPIVSLGSFVHLCPCESALVGEKLDGSLDEVRSTVARVPFDTQENGAAGRALLKLGGELARVHRVDAIVVIGAHEERRGVLRTLHDVMVRRVGEYRLEVIGI